MNQTMKRAAAWLALVINVACATSAEPPGADSARVLEATPAPEHVRMLETLFARTNVLVVRHTPGENMGRGSYDERSIDSSWRFMASVRCRQSCRSAAPSLYDSLASGLKVDRACPPRFTATVGFLDDTGREVATVYLHESYACYMFASNSFLIKDTRALSALVDRVGDMPW